MAMNKQRRTSNLSNILNYDDAGNIVLRDYSQTIRYNWNGTIHAFTGPLSISSIAAAVTDTDRFLVSDGGVLKYRTGAEVMSDIGGVPSTRTLTINGTAFDLSADRSWTINTSPAGANTEIQYNNAGAFGASAGLTYNDSTGVMTLSKNQNANTELSIINTTSGTASGSVLRLTNQTDQLAIVKLSSTNTGLGWVSGNSGWIYSGQGNLDLTTDLNSKRIRFGTLNGAGSPQMSLTGAGRLLLGTTTESTFLLDVNGTARVSGDLTVAASNILTTRYLNMNSSLGSNRIEYSYSGSTLLQLGRMQGAAGLSRQFDLLSKTPDYGVTSQQILTLFPSVSIKYDNSAAAASTTATETPSACFEIFSINKGFLQPRLTTVQRDAIASPATGLSVYNTTTNTSDFYNGTSWSSLASGNIYTTDGTLTANRTISTTSGFTLTINPLTIFNSTVTLNSASSERSFQSVTALGTITAIGTVSTGLTSGSTTTQGIRLANPGYGGFYTYGTLFPGMYFSLTGAERVVINSYDSLGLYAYGTARSILKLHDSIELIMSTVAGSGITWGTNSSGLINASGKIFTTGNVTIGGTTDAGFKLDVNGTARVSGSFAINTTIPSPIQTTSNFLFVGGGGIISSLTASPELKLSSNIYFDGTNDRYRLDGSGSQINMTSVGSIQFLTCGASTAGAIVSSIERMRLTQAGRLLLGLTTESTFLLDVNGSARVSGGIVYTGGAYVAGSVYYSSTFGLVISGRSGSTSDVLLTDANGSERFEIKGADIKFRNSINIGNGNIRIGGTAGDGSSLYNNTTYGITILGNLTSSNYSISIVGDATNNGLFLNNSGQVKIGRDNATYNASAVLEVSSTTKGFRPPVMTTTQKNAIGSPAAGLVVYDNTDNYLSLYNGTNWQNIVSPNSSGNVLINSVTDLGDGAKLQVNGGTRINHLYTHTTGVYTSGLFSFTSVTTPTSPSYTSGMSYGAGESFYRNEFQGSATIPNSVIQSAQFNASQIRFVNSSTAITMTQGGSGIRAYASEILQFSFDNAQTACSVSHVAGMQILAPYYQGANNPTITNLYGIVLNDSAEYSATLSVTNRWAIYQDGASDNNYFKGKVVIGSTNTVGSSRLNVKDLPTSATGLATGDVWNNGGVLNIV